MFYKNWPYWLKGGFIGLIIGLISVSSRIILSTMIIDGTGRPGFFSVSSGFIASEILKCLGYSTIGLVIGWIYGKIKNKK